MISSADKAIYQAKHGHMGRATGGALWDGQLLFLDKLFVVNVPVPQKRLYDYHKKAFVKATLLGSTLVTNFLQSQVERWCLGPMKKLFLSVNYGFT
jgi:hypothetical protein